MLCVPNGASMFISFIKHFKYISIADAILHMVTLLLYSFIFIFVMLAFVYPLCCYVIFSTSPCQHVLLYLFL